MQVLHRQEGEDGRPEGRVPPVAPDTPANITIDTSDVIVLDDELALQASQMTAVAVAAAAVTAAVVTSRANDEAVVAQAAPVAAMTLPEAPVVAEPIPQPQPIEQATDVAQQVHQATGSAWPSLRALLVSLVTLACIGLGLWLSSQGPWSERMQALLRAVPSLPAVKLAAPPVPSATTAAPVSAPSPVASAPTSDDIARMQAEAEQRAHQLADKRAQAQARRAREDAALAAREERRRDAQRQLDEARSRAERAQQASPASAVATPAIVAPPPTLSEQLQQCSALSVFARERCLWQLCDGKWGKDGCPSYQHSNDGA